MRELVHQDYVVLETQLEASHLLVGAANLEYEHKLFAMLKPSLQKDGNQWCVLYGENLQTGIAGFGDSPYLAVLDFHKNWFTKTK
jgi:hypothetical protein